MNETGKNLRVVLAKNKPTKKKSGEPKVVFPLSAKNQKSKFQMQHGNCRKEFRILYCICCNEIAMENEVARANAIDKTN